MVTLGVHKTYCYAIKLDEFAFLAAELCDSERSWAVARTLIRAKVSITLQHSLGNVKPILDLSPIIEESGVSEFDNLSIFLQCHIQYTHVQRNYKEQTLILFSG